ncbi:hypothetical protein BMETH_16712631546, partial [methanotrophic bacterial endosymbiont of Bathymodiolus sp.]
MFNEPVSHSLRSKARFPLPASPNPDGLGVQLLEKYNRCPSGLSLDSILGNPRFTSSPSGLGSPQIPPFRKTMNNSMIFAGTRLLLKT